MCLIGLKTDGSSIILQMANCPLVFTLTINIDQTCLHYLKETRLIRGHMDLGMFCEILFVFVSFSTLVALERLLPSVCYHVALQVTRRSASVVALVTLVWLFSCVVPHHVNFQITSLNT